MKRAAAVIGLALVVATAGGWVFIRLGGWLVSPDPVEAVDVLVVPSGDPDRRFAAAVEYLGDGLAEAIWLTVSEPGPVLAETEAVRTYAREHEVHDAVRIIGVTDSTRSDARRTLATIQSEGLDRPTIAIVTSPERISRARITFERMLGDHARVRAWSDGSEYRAERWWRTDAPDTLIEAGKLVGTMALIGPTTTPGRGGPGPQMPLRALIGGAIGTIVAGFAVRPVARRLRLVARPRLFRVSPKSTPLLGGAAILAGMGVGVVAGGGVRVGSLGIVAVGGILLLALVGLVDDLAGLGPRSRLVWAGLAGSAAWLFGLRASVFPVGTPGADIADAVVTLLWFVGVTHALNVLDHVDGAAGGVSAVSAAFITLVAVSSGQIVVALGGAALCGASLGYLVHNFPPARLFMGDMGALGIGFALASLAMALSPEQRPPLSMAVAVLVLGVPLFDVTLVTVSRLRSRTKVSVGGTDHTTHRLIARGLSVRQASAFLWVSQAVLGALAVSVAIAPRLWAWVVVSVVGVAGLAALVVFLRMSPWRTAAPKASPEVVDGLEEAVAALTSFSEAAAADGLTSSDPGLNRAARAMIRRLEGVRRRLRSDEG